MKRNPEFAFLLYHHRDGRSKQVSLAAHRHTAINHRPEQTARIRDPAGPCWSSARPHHQGTRGPHLCLHQFRLQRFCGKLRFIFRVETIGPSDDVQHGADLFGLRCVDASIIVGGRISYTGRFAERLVTSTPASVTPPSCVYTHHTTQPPLTRFTGRFREPYRRTRGRRGRSSDGVRSIRAVLGHLHDCRFGR